MTRHQPISIPSRPRRGRECQCAAAGLADVVRGRSCTHLNSAGVGEHPLAAARGCAVSTSARSLERQARLGDPRRERVAHPLQLAEAEHPRLGRDGGDPQSISTRAEGLGEEAGELALEAADLAPQLGAREALVAPDAKRQRECLVRADPA